ncbi:MAG: hypothetical protein IPM56_14770 [Ignavibacteriales bacterium]|nr:MAG: hypothetical protein IPM56_14770 [Ignavibacteriales bacterium]
MNKIVLHFGLLVFFLTIIFFSQKGEPLEGILLKSTVVFILTTTILSILTLLFMRSITKSTINKQKDL